MAVCIFEHKEAFGKIKFYNLKIHYSLEVFQGEKNASGDGWYVFFIWFGFFVFLDVTNTLEGLDVYRFVSHCQVQPIAFEFSLR